jgi:SAM-dependent methyltransferase
LKEKQIYTERSRSAYTGLDLSEELIKIAKSKYPEADFKVSDMKELPFLPESFDIIFCIAAFHHLKSAEERLQTLREMKRSLKSGGKIIIINWNLLGEWGRRKVEKGDYKRFGNDFSVPWKNSQGKILGERFYHAFTPDEIELLCKGAYLRIEQNFYSKKGERSDKENGENIITVITKI